MTIEFVKMHGAGNDFIMIDDRAAAFPTDHEFIARIARRPDGIGSEGLILVRKSTKADFAMRFFNPDGSEADLCGNGARCVAAFAYAIGAVRSKTMRFETRAGLIDAEVLSETLVRIAMPRPKDLREDFVNSGVPHAIRVVEDLGAVEVEQEGRRIRHANEFAPAGTNVDFVKWTGEHALSIRTYERGVEAETFACGTGSVAAALIGVAQYGLKFPVVVTTVRGVELTVDGRFDGTQFDGVTLTGPVRKVFSGSIQG